VNASATTTNPIFPNARGCGNKDFITGVLPRAGRDSTTPGREK